MCLFLWFVDYHPFLFCFLGIVNIIYLLLILASNLEILDTWLSVCTLVFFLFSHQLQYYQSVYILVCSGCEGCTKFDQVLVLRLHTHVWILFFRFVCSVDGRISSLSSILLFLVVLGRLLPPLVWVLLHCCCCIILCCILCVYQIQVLLLASIFYHIICIWMYRVGKCEWF